MTTLTANAPTVKARIDRTLLGIDGPTEVEMEGPTAADSAWWAMASEDLDVDRQYAAMLAARPFMLPGETGLSDFDTCPGLIA